MQSILNESNHRKYNPGNERIVKKYLEHVRRTRARHIEDITHDDRIVALQQDFGHSSIGTTRCNYGNITPSRQRELIAGIKVE